jgi:chitinase
VSRVAGENQRVVCYYTNWSVYRPGTAKFNPQNINPYLCTHLIYAFGGLTKENGLRPFDKYQDIEQGKIFFIPQFIFRTFIAFIQ